MYVAAASVDSRYAVHSIPFDRELLRHIHVNRSALGLRAALLGARRSFRRESEAAALLRAVQCLDLTTLAGDDTEKSIERLCAQALHPVAPETLCALGIPGIVVRAAAVCVYQNLVPAAVRAVRGAIPVAAVSTGFPAGQISLDLKLAEIERSIAFGAREIDVVISRALALEGRWGDLYDEISLFCRACDGRATVKTIIGAGDLGTLENVARASAVAIMAGSDFIKTSTGFEPVNATFEAGLVMAREIRRFEMASHGVRRVGLKAAGGIRSAETALLWLTLMREECGEARTRPDLFRIGASGLLADLQRQLRRLAAARSSAEHQHAMA